MTHLASTVSEITRLGSKREARGVLDDCLLCQVGKALNLAPRLTPGRCLALTCRYCQILCLLLPDSLLLEPGLESPTHPLSCALRPQWGQVWGGVGCSLWASGLSLFVFCGLLSRYPLTSRPSALLFCFCFPLRAWLTQRLRTVVLGSELSNKQAVAELVAWSFLWNFPRHSGSSVTRFYHHQLRRVLRHFE